MGLDASGPHQVIRAGPYPPTSGKGEGNRGCISLCDDFVKKGSCDETSIKPPQKEGLSLGVGKDIEIWRK